MSGGNVTSPRVECRKFVPNIFNKSKCSSCFKHKEEHSAEALESNRATRKISKCGYLFVAPGWDFSNPLNRTKRWQRRWFILYDDGELTYSLDEHPETVPQARIDMTRVQEVAAADDVTGHPYSLAITSPEGVTFIKGTCREETRWWADVLQVYSRNKGRHKRNATFPGGQTTILQVSPTIRSNTPNPPRPRLNSCQTDSRSANRWSLESNRENSPLNFNSPISVKSEGIMHVNGNTSITCIENGNFHTNGSTYNYGSKNTTSVTVNGSVVPSLNTEKPPIAPSNEARSYRDQPASSASPPTRDKLRVEDKAKRRMNQQIERSLTIVSVDDHENIDDDACRRILLEHENEREREGKLRDIAVSLTQPRVRRNNKTRISEPTRDVVDAVNQAHQVKLIRGDPDGCGLDLLGTRYSPTSELRVDLPAEDLLNIKKGWLMKQSLNKDWNKHWFVLRGCGLMYYRDPTTEDKGIMDGVIDLNTVTAVTPVQVARNYGFQTVTWDDRGTTVLSAVTAGIRSSWISAIRKAANLPDLDSKTVCQHTQQDAKPQSPTVSINDSEREPVVPTTSLTPRSVLFSSDEEYRTASEGGRRESGDWSEIPVTPPLTRNGDWPLKGPNWSHNTNQEWSELPPSPPLTRTALSRVKARSRSSSRSRVYKRSRSSPPSSRRSTLDSVRSEDLMMACCELGENEEAPTTCLPTANDNPLIVELLESQVTLLRDQLDQNHHPSSLLDVVERQENEIENLKSQLNLAQIDVSNSEKELSKLRQQKAEAAIREKQIEDLLITVQRTEQLRKKDIEESDKLKKLFTREKESLECKILETESILRETTGRCEILTNELSSSHRSIEHLQSEILSLSNKLAQGIEENERLYTRIRELECKGSLSTSRERGRSFDSLSDLTNIDLDLDLSGLDKERIMEEFDELRGRFEKAVLEIRAMRKELREAHTTQDALELQLFAYKQDNARAGENNQAQVQLMAARIQDLTNKLGAGEKQVRALKQKLTKVETRDKRRSLSLKGKESFFISQEVEEKLLDLENKILAIEQNKSLSKESMPVVKKERTKKEHKMLDKRLRRKSLDSATNSEPMKVLIRLSTLETKVATAAESVPSDAEKDSSECSELSTSSISEVSFEVILRLKILERAIFKSKRRLEKCLGSTQAEEKAEKCLREVNDILESCNDYKKIQVSPQLSESVGIIVSRLESLLKNKIMELTCRRRQLDDSGKLDEHAKLRLMAEKLAYEFVIMRQLKLSISNRTNDRCAILSELVETSQLISNFKSKIHGTKPKTYQNTSYIQYLTKVLANKLLLIGGNLQSATEKAENIAARVEMKKFLIKKKQDIDDLMDKYKVTKLRELADALAIETLNLSDQDNLNKNVVVNSPKKLLEDQRIREAWALAHETVNKELVQAEVTHVILKCSQMYEQSISSIIDTCLAFEVSEQLSLETWADETQARLKQEMKLSIQELTIAYEESLERMKNTKPITKYDSRKLLTEYADIIAQKALIDARITVLSSTRDTKPQLIGETYVSSLIKHEDLLLSLVDEENWTENPIFDAEYVYLFQHFSQECEDKVIGKKFKDLKTVGQSVVCVEEALVELGRSLQFRVHEEKKSIKCNPQDWSSIYKKCNELGEHIKHLGEHIKSSNCKQCNVLQESMTNILIQHAQELKALKISQENDLLEIKDELDLQRNSLTSQYEHEASNLRERARKLEHRLNAMDSEHSAHVNELRSAYQRSISADLDTDTETRKRYKEEIKQLRALCEKGLIAMENSHRRIITEMEEKHRQELENLRIDKEQALSEETQATLAALDAMRKAHENEVQKEIAKFKQEFLKQMQARENIGILHKEHDLIFREEMEEIKQEILSLSSKYSSKCVESAALEEKVGLLTKQVSQAQHHIIQLNANNKQLRAHLILETNDPRVGESSQLIHAKENEIIEQQDEIHRLQQQLKHGNAFTPIHKSKCAVQDQKIVLGNIKTSSEDKSNINQLWDSFKSRTSLPHKYEGTEDR